MKHQFDTDWADAACGPLSLRTAATAAEIQLIRDALQRDHYLGAGRPAGHVLWQGVYEIDEESQTEQLVAALCWGGAALRLKDRDEWLGWDPVTRANRLNLVTQLRRFMVVEEARRPNLASRCLALALRTLAKEWRDAHGFAPLMAESFSDPESHQGTLYKVTNWLPMGQTAGYSRSRADFYTDTQKPKLLWLYPLKTNARELLGGAGELPAAHAAGIKDGVAGARCPLKCSQLRSLRQALCRVPDPRSKKSRRHPIGALLGIICLGLLGGARDVMSCWRKGGPLSQEQRRAIGLIRRDKSGRLFLPCYAAFNDLLAAIDSDELARVLNAWLAQNEGTLPRSLAMDGKSIGGLKGGIITLCHQATGAPVAMAVHQGAKADCEMPGARELLESVEPSLDNAVITADALHCQKKTARTIVERGGDYLIALHENQPGLREQARRPVRGGSPPLPASAEKRDGCIVERHLKAATIDAENCGFPDTAQVIEEERRHLDKETGEVLTDAKTGKPKIFIRHFITSLRPGEADAKKLAELIRNHWGVENRNHWRRDASRWKEDACRLRKPQAAQNLALLRNALLALIPPESGTMEQIFERYTLSPAAALKLLNSKIRSH